MWLGAHDGAVPLTLGPRAGPPALDRDLRRRAPGAHRNRATFSGELGSPSLRGGLAGGNAHLRGDPRSNGIALTSGGIARGARLFALPEPCAP